ncbi:YlbF family regulator [Streptococcus ratti]|uniref:Regulatory protein ylbF n=1 Tax=Streptococcus ratti FA-1 = DSM 20564 TaxID=699248 RepID=A0ABP2QWD6_STRRT|nr:YlbF family regulator [Streptococcus ratti]EJN93348.1 hypothetical protein SRA_02391 [Streptococcus ratti FA-1 = DSM 20564]EMP68834.1 hypothetical protein D822_09097 [Streptococcus ratti FA-1 = DSM 20564]QEY07245.1 YlbF family regulator [Streptococcus ratti]VEI59677.1 Regulatory protein ylbF [Streptococcus mutans]
MLKMDDQLLAIDDALDDVIAAFLDLDTVKAYQVAVKAVSADEELQKQIDTFQHLKADYDRQQFFGKYRPEVAQLRKAVLRQKRQLDLNDKMIAMRRAEVDLQTVLAEVSQKIAAAVSPDIFVDTGLPLAPRKAPHKKGRGKNIKEG